MARFILTAPGPRPPYSQVAERLWGQGCDFDSDGDSSEPEATDWTELTVTLRGKLWEQDADVEERVDIDPIDGGGPLVLAIKSDSETLARRTAEFLHATAGGTLSKG